MAHMAAETCICSAELPRFTRQSQLGMLDASGAEQYVSCAVQESALASSLLSSSTPRHHTYGGAFGWSPATGRLAPPFTSLTTQRSGNASAGLTTGHMPLLTYPQAQMDLDFAAMGMEESECDTLPFALDTDTSPGRSGGLLNMSLGYGLDASESDVAVGAFVRLIEHAPPLQSSTSRSMHLSRSRNCDSAAEVQGSRPRDGGMSAGSGGAGMTLTAGLSQLAKLRAQLE